MDFSLLFDALIGYILYVYNPVVFRLYLNILNVVTFVLFICMLLIFVFEKE